MTDRQVAKIHTWDGAQAKWLMPHKSSHRSKICISVRSRPVQGISSAQQQGQSVWFIVYCDNKGRLGETTRAPREVIQWSQLHQKWRLTEPRPFAMSSGAIWGAWIAEQISLLEPSRTKLVTIASPQSGSQSCLVHFLEFSTVHFQGSLLVFIFQV